MHRLYFIGLFVAMSGACLAVVATFLKPTEPRSPVILAPGPSGNEPFQPVALYPHSGVSMAAQDDVRYYNNTDDEIHYVALDHGQWKLVGTEKMMHELIK